MKKLSLILVSPVIILSFFISFSYSDEKNIIYGRAIVIDGDTIKINDQKIRFSGIDAPESYFRGKRQTCFQNDVKFFCGEISKDKLKEKLDKLVDNYFQGSFKSMVSFFVQKNDIDLKDLESILKLIKKRINIKDH